MILLSYGLWGVAFILLVYIVLKIARTREFNVSDAIAILGIIISIILALRVIPPPGPGPAKPFIVFSESFDGADGSYNTNLWRCENQCGIDNLFLENGALNLYRNQEGWTGLSSLSSWPYNSLASLEGKMKISDASGHPNAWLAIATGGCFIFGTESPYIQCSVGPVDNWEYSTEQKIIKFNKWYKVKIAFDQESNKFQYFLDNALIGEYSPGTIPISNSIYLGIYSEIDGASSSIHIDDVILTISN
jgi:hypothetical protein